MKKNKTVNGLIIVNKPEGITSFDVVRQVKKFVKEKTGHTGILDPIACGVLPVCIGGATRLAQFLIAEEKSYEGIIKLGQATTTYDSEGEPVGEYKEPDFAKEEIENALLKFKGKIQQVPSMFSAKKFKGETLYKIARRGEEVERKPITVEVYDISFTSWDGKSAWFKMRCSAGTYARNIAHDLGQTLGCGGHLEALTRTAVGNLRLENAVSLDAITKENVFDFIIPLEKIPLNMASVYITADALACLRHGQPVDRSMITDVKLAEKDSQFVRLLTKEGSLAAIAEKAAHLYFQPRVVFI